MKKWIGKCLKQFGKLNFLPQKKKELIVVVQTPSQFSLIRSFFKNIRLVFNILRGKEMGL